MIILSNDAFRLAVRADCGGSIASFRRHDGLEIFRDSLSEDFDDARDGASFALVPFSNRIRDRRFEFDGRLIDLEANVPNADRVAHGFGWRSAWDLVSSTDDAITIMHERTASDWPWSYRAEQQITLIPDGLNIRLSLQNLSDNPMPAGLGFHPFFPLRSGARIRFSATGCQAVGDDGFPVNSQTAAETIAAARHGIDPWVGSHYFSGFGGEAAITAPGSPSITLKSSSEASHFVFYLAPDKSFFCLEPVTHDVGALCSARRASGRPEIDVVEAGQQLQLSMSIHVSAVS